MQTNKKKKNIREQKCRGWWALSRTLSPRELSTITCAWSAYIYRYSINVPPSLLSRPHTFIPPRDIFVHIYTETWRLQQGFPLNASIIVRSWRCIVLTHCFAKMISDFYIYLGRVRQAKCRISLRFIYIKFWTGGFAKLIVNAKIEDIFFARAAHDMDEWFTLIETMCINFSEKHERSFAILANW